MSEFAYAHLVGCRVGVTTMDGCTHRGVVTKVLRGRCVNYGAVKAEFPGALELGGAQEIALADVLDVCELDLRGPKRAAPDRAKERTEP